MTDELFPRPLPIVVITGEYESGKTLAALTTGYPLNRVLLYDTEESATLYSAMGDFTRVDIIGTLGDNWSNLDFYVAWRNHAAKIEPGQYDVIAIDTIERLEAGITDWVSRNPGHFGHTAGQYQKMSGIFWGDVKDLWARHILELRSKTRMVVLTAHMRNVYIRNQPTEMRERKGKETLSELATLEIELVRKDGQAAPSAKVLKSRLVYGDLENPSSLRPMFDPWIKEFTWERVREYMRTGTDPDNLQLPPGPSEEEKEMERLKLQAEIARAKTLEMEMGFDTAAEENAMSRADFFNLIKDRGWSQKESARLLAEKFGRFESGLVADYIQYLESFYNSTSEEELPPL